MIRMGKSIRHKWLTFEDIFRSTERDHQRKLKMSCYQITLLVTEEQEDAIVALFAARNWIYVKTGMLFRNVLKMFCDCVLFELLQTYQKCLVSVSNISFYKIELYHCVSGEHR